MRTKVALATAVLGLMLAGSAHAQLPTDIFSLTALTSKPDPIDANGTDYGGLVTNKTTTADSFKVFGGFHLPAGVGITTFWDDPVLGLNPLPYTFNKNDSLRDNAMFELTGNLSGLTYADQVQALDPAGQVLFTYKFRPAPVNVPEPGSMALLAGVAMSGSLFLARRRRK